MSTEIFAEWRWACDDCGECSPVYDSRTEAEQSADAHECEES